MKIFFGGSPRALKKFGDEHKAIYDAIVQLKHDNLTDYMLKADPDTFYKSDYETVQKHYRETMNHLRKCDIMVAEVSYNSMSVGYLVEKALAMSKPVILLHLPDYEPYFFTGIEDDKLQVLEYTIKDVKSTLRMAIEYAAESQDVRFNFFVAPKHQNYLDWVSKTRKLPRAVLLRRLIEEDMKQNREYMAGR